MTWNWSAAITIRMNPKPVGSSAPAKPAAQSALLNKPAEVPSHPPKSEDEQ